MTSAIIPDVLEQSVENIESKLKKIFGLAQRAHIDIIDGIYADNLTITPVDLKDTNFNSLDLDFHLLTEEPADIIADCTVVKDTTKSIRVIGQIEKMSNQLGFINHAHELNCQAGFALDLFTPLGSLDLKALDQSDCILLMSVKVGFSGQVFNDSVIPKIKELIELEYKKDIIIDGGMNTESVKKVSQAGANQFAVNSFLWQHDNIKSALKELDDAQKISSSRKNN